MRTYIVGNCVDCVINNNIEWHFIGRCERETSISFGVRQAFEYKLLCTVHLEIRPTFFHRLHLYTYISLYNTRSYDMSCLTVNFSGENRSRGAALIFRANVKSNLFWRKRSRNEKLLFWNTRFKNFPIYFSYSTQMSSHIKIIKILQLIWR